MKRIQVLPLPLTGLKYGALYCEWLVGYITKELRVSNGSYFSNVHSDGNASMLGNTKITLFLENDRFNKKLET